MKITHDLLIESVETSFNVEDIIKYDSNKVAFHFDGLDELTKILVVFDVGDEMKCFSGIHLTNGFEDESDLQFRLSDALESCFRDGFTRIYIHAS